MKGEAEAFLSPPSPIRVIAGVWVVVVAVDFAASVAVTCSAFDVAFVCFSLVAVISVVAPAETPRAAPAVVEKCCFRGGTSRYWEEGGFVVFCLLFTYIQTPLLSFSVFVAATAAAIGDVVRCGCVIIFFPEHTFDLRPEAPHD